ncbi:unnamed protein product [Spirodela intermedia]|uniref:Uncharacterized protein n=1 Tax=Spirodela intermedia TaxID=51605 RepID=A0A7I8JQG6_SPIIN|nr:unnamed protein product [Spirodela intermedia]CAA6672408.1 unnamed protein product [Spirodela intermedia]
MTHLKGVEVPNLNTIQLLNVIQVKTIQEGLRKLLFVKTLKCHQLYLNPSKFIFAMTEVEFLGHVIKGEKDFLVEYNFALTYKLGQTNVVTNALSHQGATTEAATLSTSIGDFLDEIRATYTIDSTTKQLIQ